MDDFLEFEGAKDMKNLFEAILGSEVNIKDNIEDTEAQVFKILIKKLISQTKLENSVYDASGLELTRVTDNLWFVVENFIKLLYGEESAEVIMWFILLKYEEGEAGGEFESGENRYNINSIEELWETIRVKIGNE